MTLLPYSNVGFLGLMTTAPHTAIDSAGLVRVFGLTNNVANDGRIGLEMYSDASAYGAVQVYNRGTSAFLTLKLLGASINLGDGSNVTAKVGINIAGPAYSLQVAADSAAKPTTSTWTVASDPKLKRNIHAVTEKATDIFEQLMPKWIRFQYNGLCGMPTEDQAIGISAQDLREVIPEAVGSVRMELFPPGKSADPGNPSAPPPPRIQVEGFESTDEEADILDINYHAVIIQAFRAIAELSLKVKKLEAQLAH